MLLSLVFTITKVEISLFETPEEQYPNVKYVQASNIANLLGAAGPPPQLLPATDSPAEWLTRFAFSFVGYFVPRKTANRFQIFILYPSHCYRFTWSRYRNLTNMIFVEIDHVSEFSKRQNLLVKKIISTFIYSSLRFLVLVSLIKNVDLNVSLESEQ